VDAISSEQRVALITGATAGIGEATVRRLLTAGWRIACTGRRGERLDALARELDPAGTRTLPLAGDVTDAADRERWVGETMTRWQRIDLLVNNAGYGRRGPVEITPVDDIRRNFETNLFSLIALSQLVIPVMRRQGAGRIINVGSVAGRIARPFSSIYDSTKHALNAISDGLRGELAPFGIKVIVVQPGFIATEFIPAADRASTTFADDQGPYAERWRRHAAKIDQFKHWAAPPDVIARLIQRAADARRPQSRYSGPRHAKFLLFMRWLLSDRWFDTVVRE
jgi:NAD(P)-dependent dehydrogenase (short-subunit alcohol dehydrogenase family)